MNDDGERWQLAAELVAVGVSVRRAVGAPRGAADAEVVRTAGGDDVFGVDARADEVLVEELDRRCGARWPGTLVLEGFDDPVPVGDGGGPWRYLADPVDGSRPWLWGIRSAWVLLGAGREATTLAELEVGACIELPPRPGTPGLDAWAVAGIDGARAERDGTAVTLRPLVGAALDHRFVTVLRYAVGTKEAMGRWEDEVLAGLHTYEDQYLSTGGLLLAVAAGQQAAALDPRPLVVPGGMASHPYDLAGWLVARAAGVVVETLPPGPLDVPLDTTTPVAWAAYANEAVAAIVRARLGRATAPRPATPAPAPPGTG
jgi:fructose-1,6-bisphosphatase/inositol monophosphatase family enzyme